MIERDYDNSRKATVRDAIGGGSMARGKTPKESHSQLTAINLHRASPTGPAISRLQGGKQYAMPNVRGGSLKSSGPGHGAGRGSPQRSNK